MSRLQILDPTTTDGAAGDLLGAVKGKMGMVPNTTRAMANSAVVLESYLSTSDALSRGTLSPKLREKLSVLTAQWNECDYCLSAHTAVGKMLGLSPEELDSNRDAQSDDARDAAALRFATAFLEARGAVSDTALDAVRTAGFDDGEISEIAAHVVANIFTNYFNRLVQPAIDFPEVSTASPRLSAVG